MPERESDDADKELQLLRAYVDYRESQDKLNSLCKALGIDPEKFEAGFSEFLETISGSSKSKKHDFASNSDRVLYELYTAGKLGISLTGIKDESGLKEKQVKNALAWLRHNGKTKRTGDTDYVITDAGIQHLRRSYQGLTIEFPEPKAETAKMNRKRGKAEDWDLKGYKETKECNVLEFLYSSRGWNDRDYIAEKLGLKPREVKAALFRLEKKGASEKNETGNFRITKNGSDFRDEMHKALSKVKLKKSPEKKGGSPRLIPKEERPNYFLDVLDNLEKNGNAITVDMVLADSSLTPQQRNDIIVNMKNLGLLERRDKTDGRVTWTGTDLAKIAYETRPQSYERFHNLKKELREGKLLDGLHGPRNIQRDMHVLKPEGIDRTTAKHGAYPNMAESSAKTVVAVRPAGADDYSDRGAIQTSDKRTYLEYSGKWNRPAYRSLQGYVDCITGHCTPERDYMTIMDGMYVNGGQVEAQRVKLLAEALVILDKNIFNDGDREAFYNVMSKIHGDGICCVNMLDLIVNRYETDLGRVRGGLAQLSAQSKITPAAVMSYL